MILRFTDTSSRTLKYTACPHSIIINIICIQNTNHIGWKHLDGPLDPFLGPSLGLSSLFLCLSVSLSPLISSFFHVCESLCVLSHSLCVSVCMCVRLCAHICAQVYLPICMYGGQRRMQYISPVSSYSLRRGLSMKLGLRWWPESPEILLSLLPQPWHWPCLPFL